MQTARNENRNIFRSGSAPQTIPYSAGSQIQRTFLSRLTGLAIFVICASLLSVFTPKQVFAQIEMGSVTGTVCDTTGIVIRKIISSTNITSTSGVVLMVEMTSS